MDSIELQNKSVMDDILQSLAVLGGKLITEDDVVFQGDTLIVPVTMSLKTAAEFLVEKIELEEQVMNFSRTFRFRPWDGARAAMMALKKTFGMVNQKSIMTMFGPEPPEMRTINVGVGRTEQVPWGRVVVPSLTDTSFYLQGTSDRELGPLFFISAEGPRKWRFQIEGLFNVIQDILEHDSIYRGKAFDGKTEPEFLDLSGVDESKIVYAEETVTQLNANIWAALEYSKQMQEHGVSLKRAVLFEGPYGTGKTLGAHLTAKKAIENGWTFIYCRPGRDSFEEVMQTARLYQPCVVFREDIDIIAENDAETEDISKVLDLFDGVNAKNTQIMLVLTTNHVDSLHKGMLRPGRFDAIVHIGELDVKGVEKMIRGLINDDNLANNIDWDEVGAAFYGYLPAFVKEAAERAIRYSIAKNHGQAGVLTTDDFVNSANGLRPQFELMQDATDEPKDTSLAAAMRQLVREGVDDTMVLRGGEPFGKLQAAELDKI